MALNRDVQRLERALYEALGEHLTAYQQALINAWAVAWAEVGSEVEAALLDLASVNVTGRVTRTQVIRSQRLQAALDRMAGALDRATGRAGLTLPYTLRQSIQTVADAEAAMLAAQLPAEIGAALTLPVGVRVVGADDAQIAAIIDRTTQIIQSQTYPLAREARVAIKRELMRGITVGANPREAARRALAGIEAHWNGGLNRAMTIARTEMLDAHRAAGQAVDEANTDLVAGWMWEAHLGPRTCRACLAMHGQQFDVDVPGPQGHQQCRCARIPITKSWEDLGFTGVREPRPLAGRSAEAYFNRLSESNQRAILGNRGYEAWKRGDYPMSKWVTRKSNDGWRDAYVATIPPRVA